MFKQTLVALDEWHAIKLDLHYLCKIKCESADKTLMISRHLKFQTPKYLRFLFFYAPLLMNSNFCHYTFECDFHTFRFLFFLASSFNSDVLNFMHIS